MRRTIIVSMLLLIAGVNITVLSQNPSAFPPEISLHSEDLSVTPVRVTKALLQSESSQYATEIEQLYEVKNHSDKPLRLKVSKRSCGCMKFLINGVDVSTTSWDLAAKSIQQMLIAFPRPQVPGNSTRQFAIGIDASSAALTSLEAGVLLVEDFVVSPAEISLSRNTRALPVVAIVTLPAYSKLDDLTFRFTNGPTWIRIQSCRLVKTEVLDDGLVRGRFQIVLSAEAPEEETTSNLDLSFVQGDKSSEDKRIAVSWFDPRSLLAPASVDFGACSSSHSVERAFVVSSVDRSVWSIAETRASIAAPCEVTFDAKVARISHVIRVRLSSPSEASTANSPLMGTIAVIPAETHKAPCEVMIRCQTVVGDYGNGSSTSSRERPLP